MDSSLQLTMLKVKNMKCEKCKVELDGPQDKKGYCYKCSKKQKKLVQVYNLKKYNINDRTNQAMNTLNDFFSKL